jgi:hypothetical protein
MIQNGGSTAGNATALSPLSARAVENGGKKTSAVLCTEDAVKKKLFVKMRG